MSNKILLASHEEIIRIEVKRHLLDAGYQVETVSDYRQVFNAVKQYKPDLVILFEFPEPEMNIWQLAKLLRQAKDSYKLATFLLLQSSNGYSYLKPEKVELYDHALVLPVEIEEILMGAEKLLKKK